MKFVSIPTHHFLVTYSNRKRQKSFNVLFINLYCVKNCHKTLPSVQMPACPRTPLHAPAPALPVHRRSRCGPARCTALGLNLATNATLKWGDVSPPAVSHHHLWPAPPPHRPYPPSVPPPPYLASPKPSTPFTARPSHLPLSFGMWSDPGVQNLHVPLCWRESSLRRNSQGPYLLTKSPTRPADTRWKSPTARWIYWGTPRQRIQHATYMQHIRRITAGWAATCARDWGTGQVNVWNRSL